jgi:hypothetical protein
MALPTRWVIISVWTVNCELWSCILSICRRDFPTLVRWTASKEHLSGRRFPALGGRSSDAIDCNLGRPSLPISCYCSPLVAMFLGFAQPWLNFCSARARMDKPQNQWNMVRSGACQAASCFFVCTRIAKLSKHLRKASRHQILHQVSVGASCMIWLNITEKKKKKKKRQNIVLCLINKFGRGFLQIFENLKYVIIL